MRSHRFILLTLAVLSFQKKKRDLQAYLYTVDVGQGSLLPVLPLIPPNGVNFGVVL